MHIVEKGEFFVSINDKLARFQYIKKIFILD